MYKFTHKKFALTLLAASLLALSACGEANAPKADKPAAPAAQAAAPAPAAPAISDKSSFEDKSAYAVGASVAIYINTLQQQQQEFMTPLDKELIIAGFTDMIKDGKAKLSDSEIENTLKALDQQLKEKIMARAAEEAKKNLDNGKKFLEENKTKEGVKTTASGLQYKIIKEGSGKSPGPDDIVSVTYKGTTIDGKIFDEQKEPVDFPLNNMIQGWIEGLQLMSPGAEFQLFIPSELAYGENGAGELIAPNSALIFDVALVSVKAAKPEPPAASIGEPAAAAETAKQDEAAADASAAATETASAAETTTETTSTAETSTEAASATETSTETTSAAETTTETTSTAETTTETSLASDAAEAITEAVEDVTSALENAVEVIEENTSSGTEQSTEASADATTNSQP